MNDEIKKEFSLKTGVSVIIALLAIYGGFIYTPKADFNKAITKEGVELPVRWKDIGAKMIEAGVIDKEKFENLYSQRGGLTEADKKLLYGYDNGNLVITPQNSGIVLNMLWGFGLGNKNSILENGPMMDKRYGGADNFASTGGWTLAKGNAMDHYSMHSFITLTPEQQALVEKVSKGIFRPCCDNPTYFPDCNHGMAMLGLLELMAYQGVSEVDMYKTALQVNTLWFPDQYRAIARLFKSKNIDLNTVDPKEILSANYSSASGYQKVLSQIQPQEQTGGVGCGT